LLFFKDTPYKKRQIIALSLLGVSLLGMGVLQLIPYSYSQNYKVLFSLLEHALEGGLVGGLCDWFAVWKTYNAIETDSSAVAEEIGKWVAKDLLNQSTLRAQLNQIIENPKNQKEIISLVETYFDTKENTKKILDDLWLKIETPVINYIVNYNFNSSEIQILSDTANDKTIVQTVKICLGDALMQISQEEKFKELLQSAIQNQNLITQLLSNFINIPELIRSYGEKLKRGERISTEEEVYMDEMFTLVSMSMDKYILAWDALSIDRKTETIRALIFKIKEAVGNILARFIIEYKNDLKARKSLSEYKPVKEIFSFIEDKIDSNVSNYIGERISERLKSQDPKDFRDKIEWQTRNVLENIRINGTILGFVLGGFLGILQLIGKI
jgi:uncharacterized membrane-anchored protein YjiN (DUF445 family)